MQQHYYSKVHRRRIGDIFTNTHSVLYAGGNEYSNIDAVLTALAPTSQGTWTFRIKPVDATPSATEDVIAFGDTDASTFIQLKITTAGIVRCQCVASGTAQWSIVTDASPLSDGVWTHLGITQNASPTLYADGIAPAQTLTSGADDAAWFNSAALSGLDNGRIADQNSNSGGESNHLNAHMDEIRFWNIAFSAAQMLGDYNGGIVKAAQTLGLVSEFRIDNDIVPVMRDNFGNNNGTYVNVLQSEIQTDTV